MTTPNIAADLTPLATDITTLKPLPGNPRRGDVTAVANSYKRFGQRKPIVALPDGTVIAGNHQLAAAKQLGWTHIAVTRVDDDDATAKAFALADNRTAELGTYDDQALLDMIAAVQEADPALLEATGWDPLPDDNDNDQPPGPSLTDRFLVPPFTILDARAGYWQERKRDWMAVGIKSEEGRDDNLTFNTSNGSDGWKKVAGDSPTTSVFDPVLCEIAYRWFSPEGGTVLDPFAGGSVRGITAAILGRTYTGIDLRPEQVAANQTQWGNMSGAARRSAPEHTTDNQDDPTAAGSNTPPTWHTGDSSTTLAAVTPPPGGYDLVFSCPPYADLEIYSDDPADLSNMPYDQFVNMYRDIIKQAVDQLAPNRFAVWVVGEVRDKHGLYRGFVPDTIRAFQDAGAALYNEAILVTATGNLPLRAGRQFEASRKLGKTHQNVLVFWKEDQAAGVETRAMEERHDNVLVFVKGDPKKATQHCGPVQTTDAVDASIVEALSLGGTDAGTA